MLAKRKSLRPVINLRSCDGDEGVSVMVLDGYRQAEIGQTTDIRRHIKAHWSGTKQFDRLIWSDVHDSALSIDSFRALNTSRIFAARTINADGEEARLARMFPPDYLLTRIGGGARAGLREMFISAGMKRRRLTTEPGTPTLTLVGASACAQGNPHALRQLLR